jgi:MFS family permease
VVWTVGAGFVLPVGNAVVADLAPAEARGRYQGAYGLAFGLAACVAPAAGAWALERLGSEALWSACLAAGLAAAAGQLALRSRLTRAQAERRAAS